MKVQIEVVAENGQKEGREKGHLPDEEGRELQKDEGQGHMKGEDHARVSVIAMVHTDAPGDRQIGGGIVETEAPVTHQSEFVLGEIDQTPKNAVPTVKSALDHDQRTMIAVEISIFSDNKHPINSSSRAKLEPKRNSDLLVDVLDIPLPPGPSMASESKDPADASQITETEDVSKDVGKDFDSENMDMDISIGK